MKKEIVFCLSLLCTLVFNACASTVVTNDSNEQEDYKAEDAEPKTVFVYIEAPQVEYSETADDEDGFYEELEGTDALKQNLNDRIVVPEYTQGRLKGWVYREGTIYEVHCQTYHSTVIQLEPGEEMVEVPYVSETDVWRISRGVGVKNGITTQFLMIKPDYSKLESTLVILTNRRVYQILLKSYNDHYMPYVQWVYNEVSGVTDSESWKRNEASQTDSARQVAQILLDSNLNANYKITLRLGNEHVTIKRKK